MAQNINNLSGYKEGDLIRLGKKGKYYTVVKVDGKLRLKPSAASFGNNRGIIYKEGKKSWIWKEGVKVPVPDNYSSKFFSIDKNSSDFKTLSNQLHFQNAALHERHYLNIESKADYSKYVRYVERANLSDKDLANQYYTIFTKEGNIKRSEINRNYSNDISYLNALAARKVLENRGLILDTVNYTDGFIKGSVPKPIKVDSKYNKPPDFGFTNNKVEQNNSFENRITGNGTNGEKVNTNKNQQLSINQNFNTNNEVGKIVSSDTNLKGLLNNGKEKINNNNNNNTLKDNRFSWEKDLNTKQAKELQNIRNVFGDYRKELNISKRDKGSNTNRRRLTGPMDQHTAEMLGLA